MKKLNVNGKWNCARVLGMLVGVLWVLGSVGYGAAQDVWRYDGLEVGAPSGKTLVGPVMVGGGEVYVGTGEGTIAVYDGEGVLLRELGWIGRLNGLLMDMDGALRVLDLSAPAVVTLDAATGAELSRFGVAGSGAGELVQQTSGAKLLLGMDGAGQLYVADPADRQVKVFGGDGTFVREIGSAGQLIGQFSGDLRALAVKESGVVYVSGGRLYQFASDGSVMAHNSAYPDHIFLTPEELCGYGSSLLDYELTGTQGLSFVGNAAGVGFERDGTAWVLSGGALQRYRRLYAGVDEPPAGTAVSNVPQPRVVSVSQRSGTTLLDIEFEILDGDSDVVEVRLLAWKDGGSALGDLVLPATWEGGTAGKLGAGVATNVVHTLTWDVGADFAEPYGYFEVELLAKDTHPSLGVHWVEIPANAAAGTPAFEVSREPVSAAELERLLLWEVAVGGSGDWRLEAGQFWYDGGGEGQLLWPVQYWQDSEVLMGLLGYATPTRLQAEVARSVDYGLGPLGVGAHSLVSARHGVAAEPDPSTFAIGDMVEVVGGPSGDFWIGRYEVTYGEWSAVRAWGLENGYEDLPGGSGSSEAHPVAEVSWYDVVKWCNAKSEMEGLEPVYYVSEFHTEANVYRVGSVDLVEGMLNEGGGGYRLPRGAEWEYAARGGALRGEYTYAGGEDLGALGWYEGNSGRSAKAVGQKQPNGLWLYDMSGNVREWCWDAYGSTRRMRGGSCDTGGDHCAVSFPHYNDYPATRRDDYGFRLARSSGE